MYKGYIMVFSGLRGYHESALCVCGGGGGGGEGVPRFVRSSSLIKTVYFILEAYALSIPLCTDDSLIHIYQCTELPPVHQLLITPIPLKL